MINTGQNYFQRVTLLTDEPKCFQPQVSGALGPGPEKMARDSPSFLLRPQPAAEQGDAPKRHCRSPNTARGPKQDPGSVPTGQGFFTGFAGGPCPGCHARAAVACGGQHRGRDLGPPAEGPRMPSWQGSSTVRPVGGLEWNPCEDPFPAQAASWLFSVTSEATDCRGERGLRT